MIFHKSKNSLNREEPTNWGRTVDINLAVLDMNNGHRNIGVRNIKNILRKFSYFAKFNNPQVKFSLETFSVRDKSQVPDSSFDIYISSGGPGSPFDDEGAKWETEYFELLDGIYEHNLKSDRKKYFFGICHSFELMVRKFGIGSIEATDRKFGILPMIKTEAGEEDPIFDGLPETFYAFENRNWKVVDPDAKVLSELGAQVISAEKVNGEIPSVTGIRYSPEMESVQFHPEAEKKGVIMRFSEPEERAEIVGLIGEEKYMEMLEAANYPNKLGTTYKSILPGFILRSYNHLMQYYEMAQIPEIKMRYAEIYN